MYGFSYSVQKHFRFSSKELTQLFWTSFVFAFILSFRKWGDAQLDIGLGLINLLTAFLLSFLAMLAHVSVQKLVAIKLGYTATYSYWVNGLLLCALIAFMTNGYSAYIGFILPGSIAIQHVAQMRLGKFRYGLNLKDIARVALAGPLSHVLLAMVFGAVYFWFGKSETLLYFVFINLFLAIWTCMPIPKIDVPTKMDAGSDGLGLFFFSRTLYVLVISTIMVYAVLVFTATTAASFAWLFILAFIIGCLLSAIYAVTLEQKG